MKPEKTNRRAINLARASLATLTVATALLLAVVWASLAAAEPKAPSTETKAAAATGKAWAYPPARASDQVDDYHGTKVADPFRWLEDTDSPETRAWIEAENALTFSFLETIPQREAIRQRLTALWNFEKFGVPIERGGRFFFTRNDGLQNQDVLCVADKVDGEPRVLLDPNTLSKDGTVALTGYAPSDDGRLLAYGLAAAGSDWQEWKIRDVATGRDQDDHLKWIKFSGVSWLPDGSGLYYSRYDEPKSDEQFTGVNYFQKLFFHRIGTPQSEDRLVYERKDEKEWGFDGQVTDDGRYLIISIWKGTLEKNQVFYTDLSQPDAKIVELLAGFDAQYHFIDNEGPTFWFHTDADAPRYRVIAIDTRKPARDAWREVIPQNEDVLENVSVVGDRFACGYLHDAHSRLAVTDLDGKPTGEVPLPTLGTVSPIRGRRQDKLAYYSFTSFTVPGTIYEYDSATNSTRVVRQPEVDFDPQQFETRQVFYASKDGRRVPMFLVHRKGLEPNGKNPTYLFGYGGFNIVMAPSFSAARIAWLEMGGLFAVPNLRGGGEYGREWHESGMLANKQRVFDDFIAAAEWLIAEGYTSSGQLAISGRSNGGLLVGAALTQRPELFGAALPGVGVMDMLRFHKFTIGWAWVSEYGSADNAADFPVLHRYSPLHNIRPGVSYPATLVTTADHDDRVVPGHSFKFAAALQAAQAGPKPVLIRIETSAGHGAGKPTAKIIDEAADSYAFLVRELGMTLPEGFAASQAAGAQARQRDGAGGQ